MRIIFILLFTTQVGCVSFWVSMGGSILGGVVKDQIVEVIKEKEKEKENELE